MSSPASGEKEYFRIYGALLGLLALTVGIAYFDLGWFNLLGAVTIAVVKAVLVLWVFMHARESGRTVWVFGGAAFFWLFLLLVLSMGDYLTR